MGSIGFFVGNRFIAYYGLMIVFGIVISVAVGMFQIKRLRLQMDNFFLIFTVCGLFGIIGAKILYLLVSWNTISLAKLCDPMYLNSLMQGGFVFYGGLIGALLGVGFCSKCLKINTKEYLCAVLPCLPLLHGFGRIGCLLVGCCYGVPYHGAFAITYTNSMFAPNNIPLFPVQGVEALTEISIAAILFLYINVFGGKNSLYWYLIFYSSVRFLLEYLRFDNERGILWGLSISQYISVLIVFMCIFDRLYRRYRRGMEVPPKG